METKQITIIPKKTPVQINVDTGVKVKKRVCAYARVSTDLEDQKNSFEAQLTEYESRIKKNPDWAFIKLYSDEGITGTSIKRRAGFQEMINDALDGKIDLILTKSISRFARNTVDCLQTVRDLLAHGVIVQFEKENLNTADPNIELALTIFASMAQEESKSISENVKWGVRSRMKRGVVHYYKNILGYDKLENGTIVVNEDEKKIILEIYNLYVAGYTLRQIADYLNEKKYITGTGKTDWKISYIASILRNEKYCGNVLLQKTVCRDFLTHKREINNGYEQQYLISDNHEPIISKEMFEYVQNLKEKRLENYKPHINANCNPFAGLLVCEHCGRVVRMIVAHPNTLHAKKYLTCKVIGKRNESYTSCDSAPLDYTLAMEALLDAYNKIIKGNDELYQSLLESLKIKKDNYESYYSKLEVLNEKLNKINEQIDVLITSHIAKPNPNYETEYLKLKAEQNAIKSQIELLNEDSYKNNAELNRQNKIIEFLSKQSSISNEIVRTTFSIIVKRKDNSLRFVIANENYGFDEIKKHLNEILNLKPIYTSKAYANDKSLSYDIVKYGGNYA